MSNELIEQGPPNNSHDLNNNNNDSSLKLDTFPPVILLEIIKDFSPKDLINFCFVNKNIYKLTEQDNFWRGQIEKYYPKKLIEIDNLNNSAKINYYKIFCQAYKKEIQDFLEPLSKEEVKLFQMLNDDQLTNILARQIIEKALLQYNYNEIIQLFRKLIESHLSINFPQLVCDELFNFLAKKSLHARETRRVITIKKQGFFSNLFSSKSDVVEINVEQYTPSVKLLILAEQAVLLNQLQWLQTNPQPLTNNYSLLEFAINLNRVDIAVFLLNSGAIQSTNSFAFADKILFEKSCKTGAVPEIIILFLKTFDVNTDFGNGITPLYLACQYRHHELVKLFLNQSNIDITIKHQPDKHNEQRKISVLEVACDGYIDPDLFEILMGHGDKTISTLITTDLLAKIYGDNQFFGGAIIRSIKMVLCKAIELNMSSLGELLFFVIQRRDKQNILTALNKLTSITATPFINKKIKKPHSYLSNVFSYLLHSAIAFTPGKEIITGLLELGADVTLHDSDGRNVFHILSYSYNAEVMQALLHKMQSLPNEKMIELLNDKDCYHTTPVCLAAQKRYYNNIFPLVAIGADPNGIVQMEPGLIFQESSLNSLDTMVSTTPLALVILKCSDEESIKILLQQGAQINPKKIWEDDVLFTPIMAACYRKNLVVIKALIENGADVNARTPDNGTMLHLAIENTSSVDFKEQEELVQLLLDKCSCELVDAFNDKDPHQSLTPLQLAAKNNLVGITKILLKAGANPNLTTANGYSPLHLAIQLGQTDVAILLAETDTVNLNTVNAFGETPLSTAVDLGNVVIIRSILRRQTQSNNQHKEDANVSITPLMLACYAKEVEEAKQLIEKGANVEVRAPDGSTLLHLAIQTSDRQACEELANRSVVDNRYALVELILANLPKQLIDAFNSPTRKQPMTPLHLAIINGDDIIVERLLISGADCNLAMKDGRTPLHLAVERKNVNLVQLFLKQENIQVNTFSTNGNSPFDVALHFKNLNIIEELIKKDVSLTNVDGKPIFITMIESGNIEIVKLMLKHGASADMPYQGKTALEIAQESKDNNIIELLENKPENLASLQNISKNILNINNDVHFNAPEKIDTNENNAIQEAKGLINNFKEKIITMGQYTGAEALTFRCGGVSFKIIQEDPISLKLPKYMAKMLRVILAFESNYSPDEEIKETLEQIKKLLEQAISAKKESSAIYFFNRRDQRVADFYQEELKKIGTVYNNFTATTIPSIG